MLNVFRASAGAGKTHHLTGEYIKLLFRKDYLPEDADHETRFNEILAVTFTNKSTQEMKERIVSELFTLSQTPSESHYYQDVRTDGRGGTLSDTQIKEKARGFLNDILNNYSDFAVSTIDSFFQKIVRSFARELNLQSNYEVELNDDRILNGAVSNFMETIDRSKKNRLFNWMLKFSEKKLEDGGGWRLEKDLLKLVDSVLTSEEYRSRRDAVKKITEDKDWLGNYSKRMQEIVSQTQKLVRAIGNEGMETLREAGFLPTDFKGVNSSKMKIFERWQSGKIEEPDEKLESWAQSDDEWYTRTATRRLPQPQTARILEILQKAFKMKEDGVFVKYNTAKAILENIYQLGILADIDREVNQLCSDEGTMLISTTTELLNRLINVDDTPFVYEKTGTHIQSYMIDEFQDTSHMQWNNFKPLIENSLGSGRKNLIVGDVKQSIYRWRGSDWGLLHSGLKNFAVGQSREDRETLDTNYRSMRAIVNFNNEFFSFLASRLTKVFEDKNIEEIFSDVNQKVEPKKKAGAAGAVEINFIDVQKDEKFEELAMAKLPEAIIRLEDAGFHAKDIAILCRTKHLCKMAADSLLSYKSLHPDDKTHVFDIISSEALMLASRHVVKTIISILRYIQNPNSAILRTIASCNLLQQGELGGNEAVREHFLGKTDVERFLEFSNRPLYDMLEGIISLLPSVGKDLAYIQAFRDCVLEFTNSKKTDIAAFLEWWELAAETRCINTPEGQDAIRIMTIHKSKGLGMAAVILPCVEGTTDMKNKGGDVIWCRPKETPFAQEDLVLPVKLSSALKKTIFAEDYQEERLRAVIDNINTMYVAFTRAKEAMIIFSPKPKDKTGADFQEVLLADFAKANGEELDGGARFLFGEIKRNEETDDEKKKKEAAVNSIISTQTEEITPLSYLSSNKLPQLSLKHDHLLKDIDAIERGNCIHEALSTIIDYNNIDAPISALYEVGRLSDEYFSCEEMKIEIHRLLAREDVRQWFKPGLRILNERTILALSVVKKNKRQKTIHRPDRVIIDGEKAVIIDYKTGEHSRSHLSQVREYKNFLRQMGFSNVEGYLWYTNPHEIVKVK